jgi:mannitol-1-/sugar-/sorbitol-6-phosphatase
VSDGTRTRDRLDHNQELYQLSYAHQASRNLASGRRLDGVSPAAVLLDLDGVLVDSAESVERHWRRWAEERSIAPEEVLAIAHGTRTVDVIRRVAPGLHAEHEAEAVDRRQAADGSIAAVPGARELVDRLPTARWAVATSGSREMALARLRGADLRLPPVLVSAGDIATGKPDPECYLRAARRLGVVPADCVVVEDSPPGVRAGIAAGMTVIAVPTTHDPPELSAAHHVEPDLRAVAARLEDLFGPDG